MSKARRPELYWTWAAMWTRCTNPKASNFKNYGGRGIKVCEAWRSFAAFREAVGPRPSAAHQLDRIDNSGHYEPGNVRWATSRQQAANRRRPANHTKIVCRQGRWMARVTDEHGVRRSIGTFASLEEAQQKLADEGADT